MKMLFQQLCRRSTCLRLMMNIWLHFSISIAPEMTYINLSLALRTICLSIETWRTRQVKSTVRRYPIKFRSLLSIDVFARLVHVMVLMLRVVRVEVGVIHLLLLMLLGEVKTRWIGLVIVIIGWLTWSNSPTWLRIWSGGSHCWLSLVWI